MGAKQTFQTKVDAATATLALIEAEVTLKNLMKTGVTLLITGCEEV